MKAEKYENVKWVPAAHHKKKKKTKREGEREKKNIRTQTLEIVHIHFADSRCLDS